MFASQLPPGLDSTIANHNEMDINIVGVAWFGGNICFVIWWNKNGYTGYVDENEKDVLGCMQAQVSPVAGYSQELDASHCMMYGALFPLDLAVQIIDVYGGWLKPTKLEWRPRAETNSPLKLKLKNKLG